MSETQVRNSRKVREGVVVSDKMDKTITVAIEQRVKHALYGKVLTKHTKLKAHDENNDAHVGDTVEISDCRPLSKEKRWRVSRIVERAK